MEEKSTRPMLKWSLWAAVAVCTVLVFATDNPVKSWFANGLHGQTTVDRILDIESKRDKPAAQ
jgi:hypothetical protein